MKLAHDFTQFAYINGEKVELESSEEVDEYRESKSNYVMFGDDDRGEIHWKTIKVNIRAFSIPYNILRCLSQRRGSNYTYIEIVKACWPPGTLSESEEDQLSESLRAKKLFYTTMRYLRSKIGKELDDYITIDAGVFIKPEMLSCWLLRRNFENGS